MGTLQHSVLGTRYVYDACADPVFIATLLDTIRTGARQADLHLKQADGTETLRETHRHRPRRRRHRPPPRRGLPPEPLLTTSLTALDGWQLPAD